MGFIRNDPAHAGFSRPSVPPEQIGLIGHPQSGMSGLVRSAIAEAYAADTSLFADRWRLLPNENGLSTSRAELLWYLVNAEPEPTDRAIRSFTLAPADQSIFGRRARSRHQRTIEIFDTSAVHQYALPESREPGWVTHAYLGTPHIVLCHPCFPTGDHQHWYDGTFQRLRRRLEAESRARAASPLRTLVVAFTRYELSFVMNPRGAWRRARTPAIAYEELRTALHRCPPLLEGLRSVSSFPSLRIVGIPVSTFGFVRGDGRPNCDFLLGDQEPFGGPRASRLLTRPDIYCRPVSDGRNPSAPIPAAPMDERIDWLLRHWRPFLTADPFITCVSGQSHDLVFDVPELLEEERHIA